jgi:hypothetical protein
MPVSPPESVSQMMSYAPPILFVSTIWLSNPAPRASFSKTCEGVGTLLTAFA